MVMSLVISCGPVAILGRSVVRGWWHSGVLGSCLSTPSPIQMELCVCVCVCVCKTKNTSPHIMHERLSPLFHIPSDGTGGLGMWLRGGEEGDRGERREEGDRGERRGIEERRGGERRGEGGGGEGGRGGGGGREVEGWREGVYKRQ